MTQDNDDAGDCEEARKAARRERARLIKHMRAFELPLGPKSRKPAEERLRAAGLPDAPGYYRPDGNGGLIPALCIEDADFDKFRAHGWELVRVWWPLCDEARTLAGKPWVDSLAGAVKRLGHADTSAEYRAARFLEAVAIAHRHARKGKEFSAAVVAGLEAGRLWQLQRDDGAAGGAPRGRGGGGAPRARAVADREEKHGLWFEAFLRLEEKYPGISYREAGQRIAPHYGEEKPDTVSRLISKMRGPKK
jgi:hypothetical protein